MRKLSLIFILFGAVFYVLCTSRLMAEDESFCLKGAYISFINNSTASNSIRFGKYIEYHYKKSPIACLKYLENHFTEWKLNYIFWQSQNEDCGFTIYDPSEI